MTDTTADITAPTLRRLRLADASEADRRALTDRASTATPDIRAKARTIVERVRDGYVGMDVAREGPYGKEKPRHPVNLSAGGWTLLLSLAHVGQPAVHLAGH